MITHDELLRILDYCPATGQFKWRVAVGYAINANDAAGYLHKYHGYVVIRYRRKGYLAHRLAWLYVYGRWPAKHLDHINGDRADNRIGNLRECSQRQNEWNKRAPVTNTSGRKGVKVSETPNRWHAQIRVNGKLVHLGTFSSAEDAETAYKKAAETHFGQFAGHLNRGSNC